MAKNASQAGAKVKIAADQDVLNFGAILGTAVEKKLRFKPRVALGGLCVGRLVGVEVRLNKADANDKNGMPSTWEYAGLELPNLVLTFVQEPTSEDPNERVYEHYLSPYTNVKKNGDAVDRAQIVNHYSNEYAFLRHIANVYTGNANFDLVLSGAVPDINPFLADPIKRIEGIKAYFEYWATLLKGKDGKGFASQVNFMKLIASPEGTYLKLPDYVNDGFIEKFVPGRKPGIEIKPNESTTLIKKEGTAASSKAAGGAGASDEAPDDIKNIMSKYE